MTDKRHLTIYMPSELFAEVEAEAKRTDRSVSWLLQQAWRVAREKLKQLPDAVL